MKTLLVVDDDPDRGEGWQATLRGVPKVAAEFEVRLLSAEGFSRALEELESRRDAARGDSGGEETGSWELELEPNEVDDADLLVLDYDLYELGNRRQAKARERVTGEEVAYLARCYSRCKTIVALNQFGENGFDLTLRGHPESFADLNIGSRQLGNPGLWGAESPGFRPWVWPNLIQVIEDQKRRVDWLRERLARPVLEGLALATAEQPAPSLSREALRFLGPADPLAVSFRSFVADSGQGLDRNDGLWEPAAAARIAAARLAKWLERLVLAGQDCLVDAPHLVARFPSLIPGDRQDSAEWNAIAVVGCSAGDIRMEGPVLDGALYDLPSWLSRPAWMRDGLVEDSRITEVSDPWGSDPAELTFCEDISQFVLPELARSFSAALSTPFLTRNVVDLVAAKKAGMTWFEDFSLQSVTYEPSVQFAL